MTSLTEITQQMKLNTSNMLGHALQHMPILVSTSLGNEFDTISLQNSAESLSFGDTRTINNAFSLGAVTIKDLWIFLYFFDQTY